MKSWKLNTINLGKLNEFKQLFAKWDCLLEATAADLKEIDADPLTVVVHKASQLGEYILVEDTSLEIEGAAVGINVRWLLDHLHHYLGKRAHWIVLLAYHHGNEVKVYQGSLSGTIIEPRGSEGFGFDPVFLPDGAEETLAQSKPDAYNARAKAVENLMKGNIYAIRPVIKSWDGPWQKN
jgi:XTP/dITP diphosphohydrolase